MKTIKERFQDLSPEIRDLAIRNTNEILFDVDAKCLGTALLTAFPWNTTPEGYSFWFNLYSGTDHFQNMIVERRKEFDAD